VDYGSDDGASTSASARSDFKQEYKEFKRGMDEERQH
jgi:hypothetical protein